MLNNCYGNPRFNIIYGHNANKSIPNIPSHRHNDFEIYFFISGDLKYHIGENDYSLNYGDVLVINEGEIHKPVFKSNDTYERIVILFDPSIATIYSLFDYNLLSCFINRPKGEQNKITLDSSSIETFLSLTSKIHMLDFDNSSRSKLLKLSYLIELLVLISDAFLHPKLNKNKNQNSLNKIKSIMSYIDNNLEGDLSLDSLGNKFYINSIYLSHLFKEITGASFHQYITDKRLQKAKILLTNGFNVTEVCHLSGFNDYSNFIRLFKNSTGISPGKFNSTYALGQAKI